jgi:hypothetical protein
VTAEDALTPEELTEWLTVMVQQLDKYLTGELRTDVLAILRRDAASPRAAFPVLATLALLDDCLRVAHLAIDADGVRDFDEVERVLPLAEVAARKYFQVLPAYEKFGDDSTVGRSDLTAFFRTHRDDDRPFGGRHETAWRGLALCKLVAARASHAPLLHAHERMLVRVMESVFAGRDTDAEDSVRRKLRDLFEPGDALGEDARIAAFLRADGPAVFSSIAYGSQLWERDPFDVETIHGEARDVFARELELAITPITPIAHGTAHGRTMLILGQSGSGKTHLMRAFRTYVHGERLGYVGYLQMTSEVNDYARYVLQNLVSSLERPYDTPALTDSSLLYLSDGLVEHAAVDPAARDQLRTAELTVEDLTHLVGNMVSHLVRTPELRDADTDLLQALLLLQRSDAALERRVVKYLRGDRLTPHESALLGGLTARDQPEDAPRTIEQLGKLMYLLHHAGIVLLVDQVEDALPAGDDGERIQRAIDVLRKVADSVPSAVVVIACLEDVYDHIRRKLTQSTIDRLEREPGLVRLATERRRDEIEAMLARRLEYLYGALDAPWREDDPLFPFPADAIDAVANQRARDCLAYFQHYHADCIRAGRLVDLPGVIDAADAGDPSRHDDLDRVWNDAKLAAGEVLDDDALLAVLARGLDACADELGAPVVTRVEAGPDGARLKLTPPGGVLPRLIQVCNRPAQGGGLGDQLDLLRRAASIGLVPVALRSSEWTFGARSSIARKLGELVAAGGMKLSITDDELRALAAFERLVASHGARPDFLDWRVQARPLADLAIIQQLLGGDESSGVPSQEMSVRLNTMPGITATARAPAGGSQPVIKRPATPPVAAEQAIRLGVTSTMRAEQITVDVEQWRAHAAFVAAPGGGETALALHVVEQMLERGVSALLVDRRGELARYASPAWWDEPGSDPTSARRKVALRGKIDVALYTPGDATGRPLPLPVIPGGMADMTSQERDQVAKAAAAGLAAMMEYGRGENHRKREAILKKAIELAAPGAGLDALRDAIAEPDPALLAAVGNLTRHFRALAEDLDALYLQRAHLFGADGDDALDVHALLAPRDRRPQLVVISTAALAEASVAQFWVSRLLIELGRTVRARLKKDLEAVALFTDAGALVPANASPPTREPLFDLLRRARAGGLGVLLASRDPGELDYAARNHVHTWLVGRVPDAHAIDKLKPLIGGYANVAARLPAQAAGSFCMLQAGALQELKADAALMTPAPLAPPAIAALARAR